MEKNKVDSINESYQAKPGTYYAIRYISNSQKNGTYQLAVNY